MMNIDLGDAENSVIINKSFHELISCYDHCSVNSSLINFEKLLHSPTLSRTYPHWINMLSNMWYAAATGTVSVGHM